MRRSVFLRIARRDPEVLVWGMGTAFFRRPVAQALSQDPRQLFSNIFFTLRVAVRSEASIRARDAGLT